MAISASDVKKLREMTGAGMMDCKKALAETAGDFEAAIDLLRKKGQKVSASRADRTTSEGSVFSATLNGGAEGVLVALNCETDFVAKNEDFQKFGQAILDKAVAEGPADLDALLALSINGRSISEQITEMVGKIGEKIEVSAYERVKAERVVSYIHTGAKLGVLVAMKGANGTDVEEAGRNVAMQIAAMNPVAVDKDSVDASLIAREIEVGKEQAREQGKPEAMLEKIAQGKLQKFYKDNTLLEQEYVKQAKTSVAEYLNSVEKGLTVSAFHRVSIGG